MYWKEILQVYEDMGVEDIIPIAHTYHNSIHNNHLFTYKK